MVSKVIAIACDVECTSFDKIGGDLLTASFVEILEDYTLGRSSYFEAAPRSNKYFTEAAQKVHGISLFKAMTFPKAEKTALDILKWLAPLIEYFPLTFVNHANAKFDFKWIEQFMRNNEYQNSFWKAFNEDKVVNTIKLAKDNIAGLKNHKLNTVAEYYNIELEHHNALSDALACAEIYCNIQNNYGVFTGKLL